MTPFVDPDSFPGGERYETPTLLGEGGMGKVYLARDRLLAREVVIKVPILEGAEGTEGQRILKRFLLEARHLAMVKHPRIVDVYDVEGGARPFMVQERLRGRSYDVILEEKGTLSRREARKMFRELAEALAVLHDEGIVHRDLKPANFFLRDEGGLCLLDFGLSIVDDQTRLTAAASFVGSLRWVPPEVIRGGDSTPASDVYQAGLILHEVLTGTLLDRPDPPMWEDLLELADRRGETPEPPPSIPPDLRDLIRACCARDPEKRPATGRELLALVDERCSSRSAVLEGGLSSTAHAPLPRPRARKGGRRLLFFGAGALLLAGAAFLFSTLTGTRARTGEASAASTRPVQLVPFPDGLFLFHEDPARASLRWQLVREGRPTREGGFDARDGRWEADLDLAPDDVAPVLRLVGPEGPVWEEKIATGDGPPPPAVRARFGQERLLLRWTLPRPMALDLHLGWGKHEPTFKGRFRGEARLDVSSRRTERLRYELRLGRHVLASGSLIDRLERVWSREEGNDFPLDLRAALTQSVDELVTSACTEKRLYLLYASSLLCALEGKETPDGRRYAVAWFRTLVPDSELGKTKRTKLLLARNSHLVPRRDGSLEVFLGRLDATSHVVVDGDGRVGPARPVGPVTGRSAVLRDHAVVALAGPVGRAVVPTLFVVSADGIRNCRLAPEGHWGHVFQVLAAGGRIAVVGSDAMEKRLHLVLVALDEKDGVRVLAHRSWRPPYFGNDFGRAEMACALSDGRIALTLGDRLMVEEKADERGAFRELALPLALPGGKVNPSILCPTGGDRIMIATTGTGKAQMASMGSLARAVFFLAELPAEGEARLRVVNDEIPIPNLKIWRVYTSSIWDPPRLAIPVLQTLLLFGVADFDGAKLELAESTALEFRGCHLLEEHLLVLNDAGRVYGLDLVGTR